MPSVNSIKTNITCTGLLIFSILLAGCNKKDDDEGCLGCGMDYSIHEYTFQIDGNLFKNCSGEVASNKPLELYLYYHQGVDSLASTGSTDANGHFSITYKKNLPGTFQFNAQWESYCLLKVPEDSITFLIPGVSSLHNLSLETGDSLDLNVFFDFQNTSLNESDTLRYRFEPFIVRSKPYPYFIKGPLDNHSLINTIKDKRRFIQIDDHGTAVSSMSWYIRRGGSWLENSNWHASTSKVTCVMRKDSVVLNVN